ncbi:hypothetical protein SEA_THERESITA_4 [Microbacterium phage Theresita]|nr:hypothetical protein SEA_THERESITA_4 [Microbacterium phage Theresita]
MKPGLVWAGILGFCLGVWALVIVGGITVWSWIAGG